MTWRRVPRRPRLSGEGRAVPIRIFVSHAAVDEVLAAAVVDCLQTCMVLRDGEIRCTSVPGYKLPVGSDFAATILEDIGESFVVIGLITRAAIGSSWVLFELGAAWGAKRNMKLIVTDEVDLGQLPGPVAGRHVARLSDSSDVAQFVDEIRSLIRARSRSAAGIQKAINELLAAHAEHSKVVTTSEPRRRRSGGVEDPLIAGVPFTELAKILTEELVTIPSSLSAEKGDKAVSLFELFIANARVFSGGVQSNGAANTWTRFWYNEVGLPLLPFGLVEFEKLPSAQAPYFKRLVMSLEGQKLVLHCKRLIAKEK
jgi:hypothetical protein